MNIVHLLSQNQLTGAEVYAVQLIEEQINSQAHRVFQISNDFFTKSLAEKIKLDVETRSRWQFIKNIFWLRSFIQKENIHVIHSHSRAAAKLAFYATFGTGTAHLSTVHGVQHASFSKKLFNQYGQIIICVCENIKKHLVQDFSYSTSRLKVIPNPISERLYKLEHAPKNNEVFKIAIIGRSTGPKGLRTQLILNALAAHSQDLNFKWQLTLIGTDAKNLTIPSEIYTHIQTAPDTPLSSEIYSQYSLVIGSGRVAIESLITGTLTLAFGEAAYLGLLQLENFYHALDSNFGDISLESRKPHLNQGVFIQDLQRAYSFLSNSQKKHERIELSKIVQNTFNLRKISQQVQRHYESAYFLKNYPHWIPILMYHKIPNEPLQSQHKIFVTKENFEKHMQFFKNQGFSTLTFSDLAAYRKGQKSFKEFPQKPLILTFDDGYVDNLTNASPLLKKYGFRAQIFLLAQSNIENNYWDISETEPEHEIVKDADRQLWKDSAFEIGSHGFSHQKLTDFSEKEALFELSESKKSLEAELGQKINVFAFTYGITTENSRHLAAESGYDYALNTDTGGLLIEEDPYAIFRVSVFPDENFWSLYKKTARWYRKYYFRKRKK